MDLLTRWWRIRSRLNLNWWHALVYAWRYPGSKPPQQQQLANVAATAHVAPTEGSDFGMSFRVNDVATGGKFIDRPAPSNKDILKLRIERIESARLTRRQRKQCIAAVRTLNRYGLLR